MRTNLVLVLSFTIAPSLAVGAESPPGRASSGALAAVQEQLHSFERRRLREGPPLTLSVALEQAMSRNPELIALRRQYEAARHRPAQERFLAAPTFEAQIWQWPIDTLNPANTNMYMFMARQEFPGRGKRALKAALAEKEAELTSNDVAVRARAVVDEVKRAYAELFVTRKAIDVHLATVDLLRQFADVSQAKYETGRISQHDVLKAIVELSKIHDDLITLDERAQLAEARLNTLLDRRPEEPIGRLVEPHERVLLPSASELQRLALERQPELRAAAIARERAEAQLAVAKREYKPDFFAMAGYMLMPGDRDAWTGSVGITWPRAPWSRGKLDARVAEVSAEIDTARARQRAVENQLRLAVQEAYVRVKAAEQHAALLRTSILPQSRQSVDVSLAAYQTDRVDFLALIDNQRVQLDSELTYYGALSDFEQALADLERAVGAELTPAMTAPVQVAEVK